MKITDRVVHNALGIIAVLLLCAGASCVCLAAGKQTQTPQRIVTIIPSATEMLYALGLGDKIVADTTNCDYPPAAKNKPHIGDMNVNIEAVVGTRPDLVVGFDIPPNPRDSARLHALGLRVLTLHAASFGDVENDMLLLGRVTGAEPRARAVVAGMQKKRDEARAIASHNRRRPRVLVLVGYDPLYAAGRGTYIGQLVDIAGGQNVMTAPGFISPSREQAVASLPDLIICDKEDIPRIKADPAWRIVPAVRNGQIYSIDPGLIDRPTPRLADGLVQVARLIHGAAQ